ncbi:MAG: HAD family phosphatase [Bacteroidales bacterium]|nr:HAD family phosphatase [Bacteroidales bacterium]MCM1147995.1 HAD family phosphatase [Bacteroidales bacterium]MCM1206919.1 HAD family phosphatase [Bacillota bacterium]MCM1509553.1 HAD family phosphatase [Clostridium sp.]
MKIFKVALFDLDGTLMDTEGQYSVFWGQMAAKYRPDVPNLEQIIKGTTLTQIFERYFPDKKWQEEITLALDNWEKQMKYEFFSGALDFIRDIKSHGVRCAVVTSSNIKKMEVVAAKVPEFSTLFDRILTSEDFAASKPNPDCYLKGASVFGCQKENCVVFEDAFTGLQAGMSAGIYTIGLATNNSRSQLQDKCNYVLDDFEGLTFERVTALINE